MKNGETPQHLISWSPADWATSTVRARSARVGDVGLRVVYFELLNALYLEGGELPADPAKLADNLLLPEKEIARALRILSKDMGAVVVRNGRLTQPRVTKELMRCRALSEKRRRSARSRWDANAEQTDANAEHTQQLALQGATATATAMAQAKATAVEEVFTYWKDRCEHPRATLTEQRRRTLGARLKEEPDGAEGLKRAVDGAVLDPWYAGENDTGKRYWGFENIFRNRDRIEKLQASRDRLTPKSQPTRTAVSLPKRQPKADALLKDALAKMKVAAQSKRTWLIPCIGWAVERGTLIIVCPSLQHATWVGGYFKDSLTNALRELRPGLSFRTVERGREIIEGRE
jgi:hypothetical protein